MNAIVKKWVLDYILLFSFNGDSEEYAEWLLSQPDGIFYNVNLFALSLLVDDICFRKVLSEARHIGIDGVGATLVLLFVTRKYKPALGYKNWGPRFLSLLKNQRVLFLGGNSKECCDAELNVKSLLDTSNEVYFLHGYKEDKDYLSLVERYSPTICFVGMGMPKQEKLIFKLSEVNKSCKYFSCGGWIKQLGDNEINCPNFVSKFGMEWAWRAMLKRGHLKERVLYPLLRIMR